MSRISRYQDSITKYIRSNSSLAIEGDQAISDSALQDFIREMLQESDYFVSIFLLTVVNHQNRKQKVNINAYSAASLVEFLGYLQRLIRQKENYQKIYHEGITDQFQFEITTSVMEALFTSLESSRRYLKPADKYQKISEKAKQLISTGTPLSFQKLNLKYRTPKVSDNIYRFYLNQKVEWQTQYLALKLIEKESLIRSIKEGTGRLFRTAISLGWLLTGSPMDQLEKVQEIGTWFALVYQIGRDFHQVDDDLIRAYEGSRISDNYVINCGLQKAYDDYMWYKQKLISCLMNLDLYTRTVREMIDLLDEWMDEFIATTNPDLKSSYSNCPTDEVEQEDPQLVQP